MKTSLKTLLAGVIDYAGLFPPAALSMEEAVRNYRQYLESGQRLLLGSFILPVSRLNEFEIAFGAEDRSPADPWKLSALFGGDLEADLKAVRAFNTKFSDRAVIDTVEVKASSEEEITTLASKLSRDLTAYVEVPLQSSTSLMRILASEGLRAKIRTGGLTPEAFPTANEVARFIADCDAREVPFKATAGLHHPLRGERKLTGESDSPSGSMHGFVNLFLAAAFIRNGMSAEEATELLLDENQKSFRITSDEIEWRDEELGVDEIAISRSTAISFGSCSFSEPLEDLGTLGWL